MNKKDSNQSQSNTLKPITKSKKPSKLKHYNQIDQRKTIHATHATSHINPVNLTNPIESIVASQAKVKSVQRKHCNQNNKDQIQTIQ